MLLQLTHTQQYCNNIATHCNTLQHTATHCNTLQHTATHCNTNCTQMFLRVSTNMVSQSCTAPPSRLKCVSCRSINSTIPSTTTLLNSALIFVVCRRTCVCNSSENDVAKGLVTWGNNKKKKKEEEEEGEEGERKRRRRGGQKRRRKRRQKRKKEDNNTYNNTLSPAATAHCLT